MAREQNSNRYCIICLWSYSALWPKCFLLELKRSRPNVSFYGLSRIVGNCAPKICFMVVTTVDMGGEYGGRRNKALCFYPVMLTNA
jgi:hypothetical protein